MNSLITNAKLYIRKTKWDIPNAKSNLPFFNKLTGVAFILLMFNVSIMAQDDSGFYEIRKSKYEGNWFKLIPKHFKVQYAGSMGLVSAGIGGSYGRNEQWETGFMVGYIPEYTIDEDMACVTVKIDFFPWKTQIKQSAFYFEPLSAGFYINSVINEEFWVRNPKRYESSRYYTFSTKLRFNICVGQRITYEIPASKRKFAKSVSAFYEISTNDLYIASAVSNSYLKPTDYLHLSLGIKMQR